MNEATICTKLKHNLEARFPGAVVFKHHDVSTAGIPDMSVNYRNRTVWIEVKYIRPSETVKQFQKHFDKLQLAQAILLNRQQLTRYFVAYIEDSTMLLNVWAPPELKRFLDEVDKNRSVGRWRYWEMVGSSDNVLNHLGGHFERT